MRVVNLNSFSFFHFVCFSSIEGMRSDVSIYICVYGFAIRFCVSLNEFPLKRTTYTLNNENLESVKYVTKERFIYCN